MGLEITFLALVMGLPIHLDTHFQVYGFGVQTQLEIVVVCILLGGLEVEVLEVQFLRS